MPFLLTGAGFVEAPFFPGAVFLMSSWYTRAELTRRVAWLYTGNALANMFGGLIGYGVLTNLDGAHGLAGWVRLVYTPLTPLSSWNAAG